LNLRDFSSVAGNTLTGIVTRPKEMAPFHIDRGGIGVLPGSISSLPSRGDAS
jgi:hypothetical protein